MLTLKEARLNSKIVYSGSFLKLKKDEVRLPNGKISTREWIDHPGAVCIIPILPSGKIGLINQYRYPVKQELIELPAGKLDLNETPEICAKRELEEEIGYSSKNIKLLTVFYPAVGFASEIMYLYLAKDLVKTKSNLDKDEFILLNPFQLKEAIDLIWAGKITDAKTIIGLMWATKHLN